MEKLSSEIYFSGEKLITKGKNTLNITIFYKKKIKNKKLLLL